MSPSSFDPYAVLGLPRGFAVDAAALEARHRDLTRLLHPDRHAAAGAAGRRLALEKMIQVNDAFRILKDPVRRATWLLAQEGVDLGEGAKAQEHLPEGFLLEVMELREELAEARLGKDTTRIHALAARVKGERARSLEALAAAFGRKATKDAGEHVAALRYWDRFLEEVAAFEDEEFEGRHG